MNVLILYLTGMKMRSALIILTSILLSVVSYAQLPTTHLYTFEYRISDDVLALSNGAYISGFNPSGYNNQPHFINDNELLISSNYFDPAQTDILKLDLKKKKLIRVTATPQGEYSPTVTPDRRDFSVIREVLGGEVNQILWKYPLSQSHSGERALANETTVGYHSWLSGSDLATFLVGEPHQLYIHDIIDGRRKLIATNPGRSLKSQSGILYYVQKSSEVNWYIKSYDPYSRESRLVAETVKGSEDFDMLSDGSLIMAHGSKLYTLNPNESKVWKEVADLSHLNLNNLNRLQVRRNKIVLVNAE